MPEEGVRRARVAELVALKRQTLKRKQEVAQQEEELHTERWSGLRIVDRCLRAEKWDQAMKSKAVVPFQGLAALSARSGGKDQVVIGVLCAQPSLPSLAPTGERLAEWTLCDLDRQQPRKIELILAGPAMEHWASPTGCGRSSAQLGAILAVLNPKSCRNDRAVRVAAAAQVIKLGTCPTLAFCTAKGPDGALCQAAFNAESGSSCCPQHSSGALAKGKGLPCGPEHSPWSSRVLQEAAKRTDGEPPLKLTREMLFPRRCAPDPAAEARRNALAAAAAPLSVKDAAADDILQAMDKLEAASVDRHLLQQLGLYDKVGALVRRTDRVGAAATRLRRKWRVLLDSAGGAA